MPCSKSTPAQSNQNNFDNFLLSISQLSAHSLAACQTQTAVTASRVPSTANAGTGTPPISSHANSLLTTHKEAPGSTISVPWKQRGAPISLQVCCVTRWLLLLRSFSSHPDSQCMVSSRLTNESLCAPPPGDCTLRSLRLASSMRLRPAHYRLSASRRPPVRAGLPHLSTAAAAHRRAGQVSASHSPSHVVAPPQSIARLTACPARWCACVGQSSCPLRFLPRRWNSTATTAATSSDAAGTR